VPADPTGSRLRVPEAESPRARTDEQEIASGRTAATPFAALGGVVVLVGCLVLVVLGLAVLAFYLA
jgi:hypothetical protein